MSDDAVRKILAEWRTHEQMQELARAAQYKFADWPVAAVPRTSGVYTIWRKEQLLYVAWLVGRDRRASEFCSMKPALRTGNGLMLAMAGYRLASVRVSLVMRLEGEVAISSAFTSATG